MTTVRDPCNLQLAGLDQAIEQCTESGRTELVPEDPHMVLITGVELAAVDPTCSTHHGERLLPGGKVLNADVQNPRELVPLMSRNVV